MTALLTPDDNSADYLSYRQTADATDAIARARSRVAATETAETQPTPSPTEATEQPSFGDRALSTAGRVGKDIGRGVVEAPRQFIGGVSDLVHNVFTAGDSLANWLNDNVADLRVDIPKTGSEDVDALLANPAKAIAGEKGAVSPAQSTTGGLVREASRFLAGFSLAKGVVGGGFAGLPAGAVVDFVGQDPDATRLADLWKKSGLPENVLTDYLASNPDDTEIEKRFKNAVEGAALGATVEGVKLAAGYIRSRFQAWRSARQMGQQALDDVANAPRVEDKDFASLGKPGDPLVKIEKAVKETETGVPTDVAAKGVSKAAADVPGLPRKEMVGDEKVLVNFARINTGEDVKQVIRDMTSSFSGQIDEARRGTISNDVTQDLADKLGMTVGDLLQRRRGQPFNAEEAVAARQLWASSAEKLLETAQKAAAPNAGMVDQFNFRKMMAVHYAVQAEVIGARTETARALQSWSMPVGGGTEKARAIQNLIDGMGGPEVTSLMAQRLAMLAQSGATDQAIAQFARKGAFATTVDAVKEAWVNALLSSPTTHIVNTASNAMTTVMQVYERGAAEGISSMIGRVAGEGVTPGEQGAMLFGLKEGMRDAFRAAWKTLKTGESEMGTTLGKVDLPHGRYSGGAQKAISARAFNLDEAGSAGRVGDFVGNAVGIPTKMLGVEDEFFKSIGYRMELYAQSFRTAASEGLQGEALGNRVAQIISDPPEAIRIAAADAALYNTFSQTPGWFGQAVLNLRSKGDALNPTMFVLPFVRTPVNIARYAFERSPMAPLVGQWRADIAAGGARADLAMARMSTGTGIMLLASDLAMSGDVSGRGPKDSGEREAMMRQGWQPYSIKVGDRWYSYNRSDPFGMTMGFAADFTEALNRGEVDPDDVDEWQEVMAGMIAAVAQVSISKTYLRGTSELFEMMSDPKRYAPNYVNQFIASFVPAGAGAAERFIDPVTREAFDPYDAVVAKLPGLSERLVPKRDLWGEAERPRSGLGRTYDTFSPIQAREIRESPVDKEIARLNADVRRIPKKATFDGVDVNFRDWPKVYDRYVTLAGNEAKHPAWEMGAKDFLDAVVSGKHDLSEVYAMKSDGKDGGKAEWIRTQVREFRALAQREIMSDPEFEQFQDYVASLKTRKAIARNPLLAAP